MKKVLSIWLFVFIPAALLGQTNDKTISLLEWLTKRDHIDYVKAKSNAAVFYDKNALIKQTLITDSDKTIPNISIKDLLSQAEIRIYNTAPIMLMQTDWRKKFARLKVKFVTDKASVKFINSHTVYTFSEPVFLNKESTRVIIGESFICGPGCGRDDLLLCELKNGSWQMLARAVIAND
ncbi:MAG: hypothetical protein JST19_01605 [Bacteroidetes bacterium]|nr:hypothetical protein [Bacteroidota bacterium]